MYTYCGCNRSRLAPKCAAFFGNTGDTNMTSPSRPWPFFFSLRTVLLFVAGLVLLTGCQAARTLPDGYTGPTATIRDSATTDQKHLALLSKSYYRRADFFMVTHIDGKRVNNSIGHTAAVHSGLGGAFEPLIIDRKVVAGKVTLDITGRTHFGAPIGKLLAAKTYPVAGKVSFVAAPNRTYVVKGRLGAGRSMVWVEDAATGRAVSRRIRL